MTCWPLSVRALVARNPFEVRDYEDLIAGCSSQAGEDGRNLARHVALLSGLPTAVGGLTVNRLCGSGLAAVLDAARAVRCGEGELFIAGGVESMSRAPFVVAKATSAWSCDFHVYDSTLGARFPNPKVESGFGADSMPQTADNVAHELGITREEADTYAARSQMLFDAAVRTVSRPVCRSKCRQGASSRRRSSTVTSIRVHKATSKRCQAYNHCLTAALLPPATPRASTMARLRC
jgi:acetyl-CoA acetyltransferase